jgi:uncharacterized protein (TIGR00369 family)
MHEMIRAQLNQMVPFAKHIGVDITEVGEGTAKGTLELAPEKMNHIETMHAGAVYTLGEAVSGAAMSGAFAEKILALKPVAASGKIDYLKITKGNLVATGSTDKSAAELNKLLDDEGKARFAVNVSFQDETGEETARMVVEWAVRK